MLIVPEHPTLSVRRQCALLGVPRGRFYYEPVAVNPEDLALMRLLDEQYTRMPFYGVRKMTAWLKTVGYYPDVKRVRRLLRLMGLMAIYRKPNLSLNGTDHRRYPYLLRGVPILRRDQVWSTDITYIRLRGGCLLGGTVGPASILEKGPSSRNWMRPARLSEICFKARRLAEPRMRKRPGRLFLSTNARRRGKRSGILCISSMTTNRSA